MKPLSVILLILMLLPLYVKAQTIIPADSLSLLPADTIIQAGDSTALRQIDSKKKFLKKKSLNDNNGVAGRIAAIQSDTVQSDTVMPGQFDFKPDPVKVVWMGAIIPGYGQILNRSYWKLPLVYASFLGCAFAINYTGRKYEIYKSSYRDIMDSNPDTNSFLELIPDGYTYETYPRDLSAIIKNGYEAYRRYREISVIASVAVYAIWLIEAYVDAQLFDFDISTDLSLQLRPALMANDFGRIVSAGVGISFRLK